jgi:YmgG-like glycine-zipper protein
MRSRMKSLAVIGVAAAALAGCVTAPSGPSVMVLPGDGRTFDQFRYDEGDCRNYAGSQVGGSAEQAAADSAVRSAVLGTVIGAAAGAVIGGNSRGTAIGAGSGLLIGSAAGSGAANASAYEVQRRYDYAYQQCMYAKGHRVAGASRGQYAPPMGYAPPPANYPPPGYPPPPGPPIPR